MTQNNFFSQADRVVDSLASAQVLSKNGLYRVGQDLFNHKINALTAATRIKQPVTWEFGNQVWNTIDWKKDDGKSVLYWYKQRARQLRDKYDYLILAFSGGADSHNIANVFINENIKIDEVWCDWPLTHTKNYKYNNQDFSPNNMPSEWQFSIKPQLEKIQSVTDWKITLTDSTESMDDEDAEDTLIVSQYSYYATVKRWRTLDKLVQAANRTHQRVGVMIGIEKPNLIVVNDILCTYFSDSTIQYKSDYNSNIQRDVEFFYWTPDMPELHRAQCHSLLQFLKSNPKYVKNFLNGSLTSDLTVAKANTQSLLEIAKQFRLVLNNCIYPLWDSTTFQVDKPTSTLYYNEFYDWMKVKFADHRALDSHRSNLDNALRGLSHEFLNFDSDGKSILSYRSFLTKFYPIGKIK
jgi:hypothetical protein